MRPCRSHRNNVAREISNKSQISVGLYSFFLAASFAVFTHSLEEHGSVLARTQAKYSWYSPPVKKPAKRGEPTWARTILWKN